MGVTGHRALADPAGVEADVDAVLDRLVGGSGATLVAVSSLAEGADRLVARRILARPGGRLIALLPLAPVDYIADFADVASVQEFTDLLAAADEDEVILGAPTLRLRGDYLAIVTLGFGEIIRLIYNNSARFRGATG